MDIVSSRLLVPTAAILCCVFVYFRPGGIEGPRYPTVAMESVKGFDHGNWSKLLERVRKGDGLVDFEQVRTHHSLLKKYLGQLRLMSPVSAPHRFRNRNDRLAYYLNAYNALMLAVLVENCPLEQPSDMYWSDGLYWRVSFLLGEIEVTLSELESERIEGLRYRDPRVRFALFRGNQSSPLLQTQAFKGETLDRDLNTIVERALDSERFLKAEPNLVSLNPLFFWYKSEIGDFTTWLKKFGKTVKGDVIFVKMPPASHVAEFGTTCSQSMH